MTISVVVHSSSLATVTRTPGWFARWFLGAHETTRLVKDDGLGNWYYTHNNTFVEQDVDDAIEKEFALRAAQDRLVRRW